MTFKEKVQTEYPEMVDKRFGGGVKACPYHYGYEKNLNCMVWESNEKCEECWNREMPNTESTKYKQKLREKIIEEIKHAQERSNNVMCIGTDITGYLLEVLEGNLDYNAGYNKGLNDAWELARKLYSETSYEKMGVIFDGHTLMGDVLDNFTPQEALAKLKAYEDSKIEVGDVVEYYKELGVVIFLNEKNCNLVFRDGAVSFLVEIGSIKKTGKHIDIKSILEQIGE